VSILLDGVPQDKIPAASGLSNFARIITRLFGIAGHHFWTAGGAASKPDGDVTSGLYAGAQQYPRFAAGAGPVRSGGPRRGDPQHDRQAYLLASVDMFVVSAWLCLAAIVLVWLCRRAPPHGAPPLAD